MSEEKKTATAAGSSGRAPGGRINRQILSLGTEGTTGTARIEKLERDRFMERLWQKDGALWSADARVAAAVASAIGWLDAPARMRAEAAGLMAFAREVKAAGF